ncbi:ion channel [Psychrosphaera aestuarii]|uniref:ion channel n=1 Tax=Psychrosphaera aestuarii TaxID=1266052 RepID=UPI001B3328FA|nr:ion channel [Psychrosphaera aestuarii]
MQKVTTCTFISTDGACCNELDIGNGFCFWHDAHIDKTNMKLAMKLEEFIAAGGVTQGLRLKKANLENVRLVNYGSETGYDFRNSDFYRANLRNAHLFNANLESSSLMKAQLHDADLHCAKLHNCNLLGVKLKGARLDNISLGSHVYQEGIAKLADKQGENGKAIDFYEQSEEIYRSFRKAAQDNGLMNLVGEFAYKELTMNRKQKPKYSAERIGSKMVDLFCGYGEKPRNVIAFSLWFILLCASMYFTLGVESNYGPIGYNSNYSFAENLNHFGSAIYFSVVTFTTLGYGDIHPIGFARAVATFEAFIGSFALALYVVVFVKKTSR